MTKKKDVVDLRWTSRKGHWTGSEGDFRLCIKEESFLPSITRPNVAITLYSGMVNFVRHL